MTILGLAFISLEAKKKVKNVKGEIKVNSTPRILNVREVTVPSLQKKGLSIEFEFISTYAPDLATIKATGEILFMAKSNAAVMKKWKKDKKLPDDVALEVLNHLFRRCLLKMAFLADELQLPPPVGMPQLSPKDIKPSYVG